MAGFDAATLAGMNANINNAGYTGSPQSIFSDPSAGFGRMGDAFGDLASNPLFLMSIGALTNKGRVDAGVMQSALQAARLGVTKEELDRARKLDKKDREKIERAQKEAKAVLARQLMGGAQPGAGQVPGAGAAPPPMGPLAAALQQPMAGAGQAGASFRPQLGGGRPAGLGTPQLQSPLAGALGGAGGMTPQQRIAQMLAPANAAMAPMMRNPLPFEQAPAPGGAGAPQQPQQRGPQGPMGLQLAHALMGGGAAQRGQAVNLVQNVMAQNARSQIKGRKIVKDANGRQRYADTGEFVFDLPQSQEPNAPFARVDPKRRTGEQNNIREMWFNFRQQYPDVPDTQKNATQFASEMLRTKLDKPYMLQGPNFTEKITGRYQSTLRRLRNRFVGDGPGGGRGGAGGRGPKDNLFFKNSTEGQQRIQIAATSVYGALDLMDSLEEGGFEANSMLQAARDVPVIGPMVGAARRYAAEAGIAPESANKAAAYHFARRNYASLMTRVLSGAAIKDSELLDEALRNMPSIEDTDNVVAHKRVLRARATLNMLDTVLDAKSFTDPEGKLGQDDLKRMRDRIAGEILPKAVRAADRMGVRVDPTVRARIERARKAAGAGEMSPDDLRLMQEYGIAP